MPNVEVIIKRRRGLVWQLFTTPEKWEHWWGGGLKSVDPDWRQGAKMVWETGVPSPITAFDAHKELRITDPFLIQTFRFRDGGGSTTSFEIEFSPSGGASFPDGGVDYAAQLRGSLGKFKRLVESEMVPDNHGTDKKWWQFWK